VAKAGIGEKAKNLAAVSAKAGVKRKSVVKYQ